MTFAQVPPRALSIISLPLSPFRVSLNSLNSLNYCRPPFPSFVSRMLAAHGAPATPARSAEHRAHRSSAPRRVVACASADGPIRAWLDLTQLVSSSARAPGISAFETELGREVYLDISGWHLSLRDSKLAGGVASALASSGSSGVRGVLDSIPVSLGAGRTKLSLLSLLPERCVQDVESITRRFEDGDLN